LNGNSRVDTDDLLLVLARFGQVDCAYEIVISNNLGFVDTQDLLGLLALFGRVC
jgi:hypothetical protein